MSALTYPAALRDLPTLGALGSEIDQRSQLLRETARQLRTSGASLEAAWTSPQTARYVTQLSSAGDDLDASADALEQLRPQVAATRGHLESADATHRRLVADLGGIDPSHPDADVARQRVLRRHADLRREIDAVVRRLVDGSRSVDQRLATLAAAVSNGLDGLFTGGVLAGASMDGPVTRALTNVVDRIERRLGGPAWLGRLGHRGHALLDRARIPQAHHGSAPFTGFFRRYRAVGRHPVAQALLHDQVERNRRSMSSRTAGRLSDVGRWGRGAARPVGWAGTALTVVAVPGNHTDARERHLVAGYGGVEANVRAAEDVGYRTAGEVGGAVAGAKGGAVAGAALGTVFGPVGTVVGGVGGAVIGGVVGSEVGGWVGDQVKVGARAARETATDLARGAADLATDAAGTVSSAVSSAGDAASSAVDGAKDVVGGMSRRIF